MDPPLDAPQHIAGLTSVRATIPRLSSVDARRDGSASATSWFSRSQRTIPVSAARCPGGLAEHRVERPLVGQLATLPEIVDSRLHGNDIAGVSAVIPAKAVKILVTD